MGKDAEFLVEQELKQIRKSSCTREAVESRGRGGRGAPEEAVTPADQERLAEDYLAELAAKRPSGQERAGLSSPPPAPQGGESMIGASRRAAVREGARSSSGPSSGSSTRSSKR